MSGGLPHTHIHTHAAGQAALQGHARDPYSSGNPVLAVDEAELAVELVKPGELQGDGRRERAGPTGTEGRGKAAPPGLEPRPGRGRSRGRAAPRRGPRSPPRSRSAR